MPTLADDTAPNRCLHLDGGDTPMRITNVRWSGASSRTYELSVSPPNLEARALLSHAETQILGIDAEGRLEAALAGGATLASTTKLEALAWTDVALRYDLPTDTTSLLVDGAVVGEAVGQPAALAGDLILGWAGVREHQGLLGEVRVYDVARSTADIQRDRILVPDTTNLVLYVTFDEGDPTRTALKLVR